MQIAPKIPSLLHTERTVSVTKATESLLPNFQFFLHLTHTCVIMRQRILLCNIRNLPPFLTAE